MKKLSSIILIGFLLLSCPGCTSTLQPIDAFPPGESQGAEAPADDPARSVGEQREDEIDLRRVRPNETGKIMVLMYHGISDKEDEWSRHRDNFRKDLETLYSKGYRLISLKDYLDNNINVEAGYTPVIITFDDGSRGQFNIIEEGGVPKVDPNCAVGIMENFHKEYPGFGLEATFYIYYPVPFRQKEYVEYKLKYIVDKGMDIGNHTYNHANLSSLDPETLQYQLGRMVAETLQFIPGYQVDSLALPYGVNSREEYREYVYRGKYKGVEYINRGVLLVGSGPALSPVDIKFNPRKIPRIRGTDSPHISTDLYDWLEYFDRNPGERYISDGDPDTITVPEGQEHRVDMNRVEGRRLRVYKP